ncbi:hypothetical protein A0H81_13668 [Grifola frondosa]|uniref:Uncharacterized protein n=1 Tax=Grifola frondosa TaxID=5627 RepID=A0A1C7LPH1_GRIFR|nr:hypothetical protein A0H81_13668 [Grifola frondosa]
MQELRGQLSELNKQFASAGFKFYYVKEPVGDLRDDELVHASRDNVLIETLPAGALGLPVVAGPVFHVEHKSGLVLQILHPGLLILTKMKRWYINRDSTRPKTIAKSSSDRRDLDFLVSWLADKNMTIELDLYKGKSKDELLIYVRLYREKVEDDADLLDALQTAMKPEDWALLHRQTSDGGNSVDFGSSVRFSGSDSPD